MATFSLERLFRPMQRAKHRRRYLEFDVKPDSWQENAQDPIHIKTDRSTELQIDFDGTTFDISKEEYGSIQDLKARLTKGENTQTLAVSGYFPDDRNGLKYDIKIPDDAFGIWDEVVSELKSSRRIDLDCGEDGRYFNKDLKMLREINSLVRFAENECRGYSIDNLGSIKYLESFPDDDTQLRMNLPSFDLYHIALDRIYSDRKLYSSPDMFSPPSERGKNALRLELTTGCDWNKCTFCGGYSDIPYHEKTSGEFEAHLKDVLFNLDDYYARNINKVFIGGGNALSVDTKTLADALELIDNRAYGLRQISIYARAKAILEKGIGDLHELNLRGLKMIYIGIESGSDSLLKYINKGCTSDEIIDAGKIAKSAGIKISAMVMPGLGGKRFEEEHESETARVINEIQPEYLTFMGVNPSQNSKYARQMMRDITRNHNRPLTDSEMIFQIYNMLADIKPYGGKMGCFPCETDAVGHNPATFNNTLFDAEGKQKIRSMLYHAVCRNDGHIYSDISYVPEHKYR